MAWEPCFLKSTQVDENGFEKVIAFASRTLSDRERKYSTTEKEPLVYVMNHFRIYLLGRKFTVITDHNTLRWLHKMETKGSLARWVMDPFRNFNSQSDIGQAVYIQISTHCLDYPFKRRWGR